MGLAATFESARIILGGIRRTRFLVMRCPHYIPHVLVSIVVRINIVDITHVLNIAILELISLTEQQPKTINYEVVRLKYLKASWLFVDFLSGSKQ